MNHNQIRVEHLEKALESMLQMFEWISSEGAYEFVETDGVELVRGTLEATQIIEDATRVLDGSPVDDDIFFFNEEGDRDRDEMDAV